MRHNINHSSFASHPRIPVTSPGILVLACLVTLHGCGGVEEPIKAAAPSSSSSSVTITTAALPSGTVGSAYAVTLEASGGTPPYDWSMLDGSLPAGLSLANNGVISGVPTAAVSASSVTFEVKDSSSSALTASASLAFNIAAASSPPPPPAPLAVATRSLATATIGTVYSASLTATGGTTPYSWSSVSGTLPAGLMLNASSGAITGTPTGPAGSASLTFQVQDSGSPAQSATATLSITVGMPVTVSVAPARAAITVSQLLSLTATSNDPAGVVWSITPAGGSFSSTTSASGVAITLTAPPTAGVYTVTASSVTNTSQRASTTVAVTNLAGVYTYHNDVARDGANQQEYALTVAAVSTSTFGKLFSCTVDGAIYAQPLWVAHLSVNGATHNVVLVATQHNGLFAFDADANPCATLWQANLLDANHGGTAGETPVPGTLVGQGYGDITPEVGITGTPVIDPSTNILYVVTKSVDSTQTVFYQRLHAIDITTGNEKSGSPLAITATYPGIGDGGMFDSFVPQPLNQRAGLAFVNGSVYIAWASHEDTPPYYGWMIGYTYGPGAAFSQTQVFNAAPNLGLGGIWMSGGAPAADASNNLYIITGNANFNANVALSSTGYPNSDYGDSLLQLTGNLAVTQYFTPTDQEDDFENDHDFGAGGAAILADLPAGSPVTHLIMGGGKDKSLYVINRDLLGGLGDGNAVQEFAFNAAIFATGAFWNNNFYLAGIKGPLTSLQLNTSTAQFSLGTTSSNTFGFPGSGPSVSASGTSNGIVWAMDNSAYCTAQSVSCGPAVLYAYDATNVASELWNSSLVGADAAGYAVKFQVPTIANGKVYIGTRGNDNGVAPSPSAPGELDVYGLKPN